LNGINSYDIIKLILVKEWCYTKKIMAIITSILFVLIIFIGFKPFPHTVKITETAIEYSLSQEDIAVPHEISIDGTYYTRLLGNDRFSGSFYVSDIKNLEIGMTVDFWFEPSEKYHPVFLMSSGEPVSTEIGAILFDRNFETLAIQLACSFTKQNNIISTASDNNKSNFIVVGAVNRDNALYTYKELLAK